jgi:hypothetical protein
VTAAVPGSSTAGRCPSPLAACRATRRLTAGGVRPTGSLAADGLRLPALCPRESPRSGRLRGSAEAREPPIVDVRATDGPFRRRPAPKGVRFERLSVTTSCAEPLMQTAPASGPALVADCASCLNTRSREESPTAIEPPVVRAGLTRSSGTSPPRFAAPSTGNSNCPQPSRPWPPKRVCSRRSPHGGRRRGL